jgi:hypothetical protein
MFTFEENDLLRNLVEKLMFAEHNLVFITSGPTKEYRGVFTIPDTLEYFLGSQG